LFMQEMTSKQQIILT